MRILFAHYLRDTVSGAELALADMIAARTGSWEPLMFTDGPGRLAAHYRQEGFRVLPQRVETPRRLFPGLHSVQSFFLARALRQEGITAIVSNTFPAGWRVRTAARRAELPHALYVREYIAPRPQTVLALKEADAIYAVSGDVATYLRGMADLPRLSVLPDYINPKPLQDRIARHRATQRRLLPFNPDHPVVGFIGRVTRYKQPDVFVRAIPFVLRQVPQARFVVIGSARNIEKDYSDSLPRMAGEMGVAGQVAFLGHRTDAMELLSEMSVCCVPSIREPYPRTALEGQLAGCPVVAANTGGCPEMIREGDDGLLFNPSGDGAPEAMARQIVRILTDPALKQRLIEGGKRSIEAGAAGLKPVEDFEGALERLARSGKPRAGIGAGGRP